MDRHGTFQRFSGAAWLWLSDVGTILAGSVHADSGGGGTTVWATAGSVACRIDPIGGSEGLSAGMISDRTTHILSMSAEVPISDAHRVRLDGGETFVVTAVREQTGNPVRQVEVAHL